ncbi:hypothetical protein BN1723_003481 [Verticillium longisporum]|uniref:Uncharacterized protein n=1 Tax=Verticillium longisporum TaxID=100787 RepID=A0A0G4M0F6_VERLO|nr:hypothetical protein BN1723_003481 [Verticillium longisporum]
MLFGSVGSAMMTIIQRSWARRGNCPVDTTQYDETIHDMMTLELKALTVKSHSSYYEQVRICCGGGEVTLRGVSSAGRPLGKPTTSGPLASRGRGYFAPEPASRTRPRRTWATYGHHRPQGAEMGGPNVWTVEACASKSDGLVTSPGTGGGIASSGPKLLRSTIRFRGVTRLCVKGAHRWGILCKWDADDDSLADVAAQRNSSLTLPH